MMKPLTLSIFFPVYNEEENIRETILRTMTTVEDSPYVSEYEIIPVNDGSTDASGSIIEDLAHRYRVVRPVHHGHNLGYGEALKSGLAAARMDYVFFTDADLQFDIVELQNLLVHAPTHDVVIGYRAPRRDATMRLLNAWVWNKLNRVLFGLRVRDIDCAFKLFRRSVVRQLQLASSGAMISAELLIRLAQQRARIKQVPVSHNPRAAGAATGARLDVIFRALREMVQLYRGELGLVSHKEAARFMLVGVVNTVLDAVVYVFLTRGVPFFAGERTTAKFISFFVGTVSSLVLNRRWTFKITEELRPAEIMRFYTVTALALTTNVALMHLFLRTGMHDGYAFVLTTVLTFSANFVLSKFWVFKKLIPTSVGSTYARA